MACTLFLMTFWANVADDIQHDFAVSTGTYIIQFYVLSPMLLSLLLTLLLSLVVACSPSVVDQVISDHLDPKPEDEQEETTGVSPLADEDADSKRTPLAGEEADSKKMSMDDDEAAAGDADPAEPACKKRLSVVSI